MGWREDEISYVLEGELTVEQPGAFARYFRELAPLLQGPGPPDLAALGSLAGGYGVEFDFASTEPLLERHGLRLG